MSFDIGDYKEVSERLADLFAKHPDARLRGDWKILEVGQMKYVVYTAECYRDDGDITPGVGTAMEEIPGRTPYTKGSEIQNAETSAWGRAIVAIGASTSKKIASADEMRSAQQRQNAPDPEPISPNRLAELESRCIAIDAQGGEGTVLANRKRWRLPTLKECDAAALVEFDAMLTQVEEFLATQAAKAPDADGNERSAASNQANDEAAINSGKLDGPPAPAEPPCDTDAAESEEALRERIAAEVKAMKPLEVRTALTEGDLELSGNPTALRERLVAYRVWCALSAPAETNGASEAEPTLMEAVVQGEIL